MHYTEPDYYRNFQCSASKCPSTCCAEWKISIDSNSLGKYKKIKGPFANRLRNSIDWSEGSFKHYKGQCVLLNEEKLCDLYLEVGPDLLCRTCKVYPRHMEEYGGTRELSLNFSCPEAVRMVIGKKEKIKFYRYDRERYFSKEVKFNKRLFSFLEKARAVIFDILQNREKGIPIRLAAVLGLSHDIQFRLQNEQFLEAQSVLKKYKNVKALNVIERKLITFQASNRIQVMREISRAFGKLDVICYDWRRKHILLNSFLQSLSDEDYGRLYLEFQEFKEKGDWSYYLEQLIVSFVYGYFYSAVYDGDAYTKMKMAVTGVLVIEELNFCQWVNQRKNLVFTDMIENVYCYVREIEHLDENMNKLEKILTNNRYFSLPYLLCCINEK